MYNLVLKLRDQSIESLSKLLKEELEKVTENLSGIQNLRMHGQNKNFIKYFLCRLTAHVEAKSGKKSSFEQYFYSAGSKPFEIEHLWADKIEFHSDEFTQMDEFGRYRNMVGGLVLLPRGTNQAFSAAKYEDKVEHYLKENLLAFGSSCRINIKLRNFHSIIFSFYFNICKSSIALIIIIFNTGSKPNVQYRVRACLNS